MLGTKSFKIIIQNVMPKIMPVLVTTAAFSVPGGISIDTTLSYLHYGFVDGANSTSLGYILNQVLSDTF
jgi:oligopeptide transport system permease protein